MLRCPGRKSLLRRILLVALEAGCDDLSVGMMADEVDGSVEIDVVKRDVPPAVPIPVLDDDVDLFIVVAVDQCLNRPAPVVGCNK